MLSHRRWVGAVGVLAATAVLAACGGGDSGSASQDVAEPSGDTTLTWWHNATADPGKSSWQDVADQYHSKHPNISFKVSPIQNEQFTTKVPAALQSSNPPDIFQQWGGGAMATQVQSGKLMDMSPYVSDWIDQLGPSAGNWKTDGKWYGVPYDYHVVGFWYRTDLFKKAGIDSPPKTIDELNAAVSKLKAAGITPIALGSKDRWPDAFWWEYFVLRECPQQTVENAVEQVSFDDPCFVKAGQDLQDFINTEPFQNGFLGTPAQQGAGSSAGLVANGKAGMELMGDWEMAVMPSLASDKDFAKHMGWFAFPAVEGGGGDPDAALGGGDGFSCTTGATTACPDFLKYVASAPVQRQLVKSLAVTIPSNPAANDAVSDPTLKTVIDYLGGVSYNQLYFDQALPTNAGQALNSAIADFFAGQGTPESIPQSVGEAAGP